jgi:DNA polymerase III subunit epsilon
MRPSLQLPLPLPPTAPGTGRRATLGDRLCALLERRGRPLEVGHVVAQVLRMRQCPERLQRLLVAEIVDGDPRLAWRGRDLVGLAPAGWELVPLSEAVFCVVDLETTGGMPGLARVTEIGAVRVRALELEERFSTLVDPGRSIPPLITALTGIDDAMVAGKPDIEQALDGFVAFCGEDVMVAHNAPFDLRFLNYERHRLAGRRFTQPWLDTLVLSKRLLGRRAGRHDLATLANWAGTQARPCHRALPDAEATAELLVTLLGMLAERGVETLARAVVFGQGGGARYAHKLVLAEGLPAAPGVYLMRDRHEQVLYVGKAANLRRRVRAYFGPQGRHGRLIGRALEGLERVEHEVLGSEFEALWREGRLLRELRPPCNRRGVNAAGHRYLKLTVGEPFPRLYAVARPIEDDARYYGPLRSERAAREALEAIHALFPLRPCANLCSDERQGRLVQDSIAACAGPCRGGDEAAYAAAVAEVRIVLERDAPEALAVLAVALVRAGAQGRLGAGEEDRARVSALLGALAAIGRLRRARASLAVLLEAGAAPGTATAFFVADGRVVERAVLAPRRWRAVAAAGLERLREEAAAVDGPLEHGALDEIGLVHERLRQRAGHPAAVVLEPGWREEWALAAIGRGLAAALAEAPPLPAAQVAAVSAGAGGGAQGP